MGVVVAANHLELDKLVALKFMHEELSSNAVAADRFLREARAAARLQNEHVGQVLDVGRLPNGVPYIVMEYLEGQDLHQVVEQRGPLPVAEVVEYVLQACEAMAEAHAQSIIHRDLKPQNLFLTTRQDGRRLVKVLDFGISKAAFAKGPTVTSQAMGSPAYMAPEQITSARSVDARADIWSLGVILYQLLSNTLPFDGDTVPEVVFKVLQDPPAPLTSVCSGLPAGLVSTVERCLDKDREKRFASVAELAQALVPFAPARARAAISLIERVVSAHESVAAPPAGDGEDELDRVVPPAKPVVVTTLGSAASSLDVHERPRSSRWGLLAAAGGSVVVIGVLALVVAVSGSSPVKRPPSPVDNETVPDATSATAGSSAQASPDRETTSPPPPTTPPTTATTTSPTPATTPPPPSASPPPPTTRNEVGSSTPRPSIRRPTSPRDAGVPVPVDAPALEPAREQPELSPAR